MKKTLKELGVEIIGGQILSRVQTNEVDTIVVDKDRKTIVSKSIEKGAISLADVPVYDYKTELDEKKLTKEGDIVIKLSAPYYAVHIKKGEEGMLVSSFCSIIRNIKDVNPVYLTAYLNSEMCQRKIKSKMAGTVIGMLSNGKLYDLEINIPSIEKQEKIASFQIGSMVRKSIIRKALILEEEMLDALICEVNE